jgi:tetratricopeptide (TPR) repeat protein
LATGSAEEPQLAGRRDNAVFFRGVNYLRNFIQKANRSDERDMPLLIKARDTFAEADTLSQKSADEYFKQIAVGSARIFRGIAYVYEHDNDHAFESFHAAATSTYPELRARAFNDLGYVTLLLGNLQEAKVYFTKALEADPKFPYAETNLGYALLAEGHYKAARDLFVRLTKDEDLRRNSLRDVILAELAIAHIDNELDSSASPNPNAYNVPLKEMGIFNYEGTYPAALRLARIHLALADRVYMSRDYYGLEMLALAMYARAQAEAKKLVGNAEAQELAGEATRAFETVAKTVDSRCFIFHIKEGFFKPVADLASERGLVQ